MSVLQNCGACLLITLTARSLFTQSNYLTGGKQKDTGSVACRIRCLSLASMAEVNKSTHFLSIFIPQSSSLHCLNGSGPPSETHHVVLYSHTFNVGHQIEEAFILAVIDADVVAHYFC